MSKLTKKQLRSATTVRFTLVNSWQHEGKAWLAKKQEEREETKLARAANNMF